jgi:hypothetical protein
MSTRNVYPVKLTPAQVSTVEVLVGTKPELISTAVPELAPLVNELQNAVAALRLSVGNEVAASLIDGVLASNSQEKGSVALVVDQIRQNVAGGARDGWITVKEDRVQFVTHDGMRTVDLSKLGDGWHVRITEPDLDKGGPYVREAASFTMPLSVTKQLADSLREFLPAFDQSYRPDANAFLDKVVAAA